MSERWNYDLHFETDAPGYDDEARARFARAHFKDIYDVHDLEKNEFERRAIRDVLDAARGILQSLGFESFDISDDRVHVLTNEEFVERIAQEEEHIGGKMSYGHIYVRRNTDRTKFVSDCSHEAAHAIAYYQLHVQHRRSPENAHETMHIGLRRGGLMFHGRMEGGRSAFLGIDEAVTELLATRMREQLTMQLSLTDEERDRLVHTYAYFPQVLVARRLIADVADTYGSPRAAEDALFRDAIAGTYDVFRQLEQVKPGITKALHMMGTERDDAITFARTMGYADVLEAIAGHPPTA